MSSKSERLNLRRQGVIALRKGDVEKAIEALTACLSMFADDVPARVALGAAYSRKKWHDQALQMFERAVKIRPMSPDLHYDWAKALLRAGRFDEAASVFQRVLKLNPQHPKAARKIAKLERLLEQRHRRRSPPPARSPAARRERESAQPARPAAKPQVLAYDSALPPPARPAAPAGAPRPHGPPAAPAPQPRDIAASVYIPPEDREMPALPTPDQDKSTAELPEPARPDPIADWPLETSGVRRAEQRHSRRLWALAAVTAVFVLAVAAVAWLQPWKARPAAEASEAAPAKPAAAKDPLAQALDDLRQPNSLRRREACEKLAQLELKEQRHDAAQQVEALLSDTDGNTRAAAAKTLAAIGGAENVQPLLAQLAKDDYPAARREQLLALGKLKDDRAVEAVAQHLSQNSDREAAGQALQAMGSMAEKKVRDYLHYPDVAVRVEACRILQHIGGAASVPALEAAKNDVSEKVAKAAQDALMAIGVKK